MQWEDGRDECVSIPEKGDHGCSADVAIAISGGSGLLHPPKRASSVAYAFFFPHSSFSPTTMSTINVNVKSSSDKKFVIAIETTKTVLDLKNAIAEQTEVPAENQRLIYSGRVLKDPETLADYKIADGNTVHMVKSSGQRSK